MLSFWGVIRGSWAREVSLRCHAAFNTVGSLEGGQAELSTLPEQLFVRDAYSPWVNEFLQWFQSRPSLGLGAESKDMDGNHVLYRGLSFSTRPCSIFILHHGWYAFVEAPGWRPEMARQGLTANFFAGAASRLPKMDWTTWRYGLIRSTQCPSPLAHLCSGLSGRLGGPSSVQLESRRLVSPALALGSRSPDSENRHLRRWS